MKQSAGPIAFFVSLFVIALGLVQLLSTFYTYAMNLNELNSLKKQEASLIAQKEELENDIARWNDKSYVAAQARERLGFVFSGEVAVHVNHPEAVTGDTNDASTDTTTTTNLPWYDELSYSFEKADTSDSAPAITDDSEKGKTDSKDDQSNQDNQNTSDNNQSGENSGESQ